jgi:hypothetical protein
MADALAILAPAAARGAHAGADARADQRVAGGVIRDGADIDDIARAKGKHRHVEDVRAHGAHHLGAPDTDHGRPRFGTARGNRLGELEGARLVEQHADHDAIEPPRGERLQGAGQRELPARGRDTG